MSNKTKCIIAVVIGLIALWAGTYEPKKYKPMTEAEIVASMRAAGYNGPLDFRSPCVRPWTEGTGSYDETTCE
jgi:hypothetical protein